MFFIGVTFLPEYLLKGVASETISSTAGGMFYLIEGELKNHPEDTWPKKIKELQSRYVYPLDIKKTDDYDFDSEELEYLGKGRAIYKEVDGGDIWYRHIKNTPYVLAMSMGNTNTRISELSAAGTYSLVMDRYLEQPEALWNGITNNLQKHFDIPLQMLLIENISIANDVKKRLISGELVGVDIAERSERYIQRIGDSKWFLQAGPIPEHVIIELLNYIILIILAMMIAVAVWLWLRPMWFGLMNLHHTVTAFGSGNFEVQAKEHKRSPTYALAKTFNAMAQRIKSLIQTQKDLTNAVAHELRTPLSRIRFATEILEKCENKDRQRYLKGINHDIDEMGALVNELLLYAKFDQNGPKIKKNKQSIGRWFNEFNVDTCYGEGVTLPALRLMKTQNNDFSFFDTECMDRALNNLLSNACRYARNNIEVSYECVNNNCIVHVDDDGPGIPVKSYERLFEPFYRLDPSRDKGTGGYGLGLAIVKQIMLWHQGKVTISVSPLGGARFSLSLPRTDDILWREI